MADQEKIDRMLSELGNLHEYYTAANRVAYIRPFDSDRKFPRAYQEAAEEHGYTVRRLWDEEFDGSYPYLTDKDGNIKLYDADVAQEAFKTLDMDAVGKGTAYTRKHKPLTEEDFKNSKAFADDMIMVGENHDVLTFEMNPNPVYGAFHNRRLLEGSRIMNDDQKEAYIDAIDKIGTFDYRPGERPKNMNGTKPLTVEDVYNSLTFVNAETKEIDHGVGIGYLVHRVQREFDVERNDAEEILYNPTDEQASTMKDFIISDIINDNAIFNTVTGQTVRERVLNGDLGIEDNLDDFLAGLDDLNKNQNNGLQQ